MNNRRLPEGFALTFLMFALALAGSTFGCKRASPVTALKGEIDTGCACNDVECWRKNTDQGSKNAMQCAASAISAAGDLATAGQASNVVFGVKVVAGVWDLAKNISALGSRSYSIYLDGKVTDVNLFALIGELSKGSADVTKYLFGASYDKGPRLACVADIQKEAGAVSSLVSAILKLTQGMDEARAEGRDFGITDANNIMKAVAGGIDATFRFGIALNACLTNMNGAVAKDLKIFSDQFKLFAGYFKAGTALASDCGINLLESGYVLAKNSKCLAADIDSLIASNRSLDEALQRTLQAPAPRGPGADSSTSCNSEPAGCNLFGVAKFGIWLGQQTYYRYWSRATLCADMCANQGAGHQECLTYASEIFGQDTEHCSAICGVAQCDAAVRKCVNFCCRQEDDCVKSALTKAGYQ